MKSRFALLFISALFLFPIGVSAVTIDDLQAQIKDLLSIITRLQAQLAELVSQQQPPVGDGERPGEWRHRICARMFDRPLGLGVRGDDVMELQDFLKSEGHLSASATGYFGALTAQAVANWQTAEGISSVGIVGPASRERIKMWCGGGNSANFRANPQSGEAPLNVTFNATVRGDVTPSGYTIDFGDGTTGVMSDNGTISLPCGEGPGSPACVQLHYPPVRLQTDMFTQHTYSTNGTYTATLTTGRSLCPPYIGPLGQGAPRCMAPMQMEVIGKVQIRVGVPNTADPANDPLCKSWNDGCNTCSRQYPGGPAMCTTRQCQINLNWKGNSYCTARFDTTGNKPPVISGFSGPTTLAVNQTGTWTVNASDPENGTLSYNITWGDEVWLVQANAHAAQSALAFVQTSTLTHSYTNAGTYTIIVVVQDANGQTAKTSTTVQVGSGVDCTTEYAPVCGRPVIGITASLPGILIYGPPQTYSNRCGMNVAGAKFLYEGTCAN